MENLSKKIFPANPRDYKLCEEVGDGVSATVYRALCIPLNDIVAIKVLDLEKCNNDFDGIRREVQTMSSIDHANLLRAHCSFSSGRNLWVVMPYMAGGSCLHIMKSGHPDGFEQPVIATLLREVLKALVYLHAHGHIHRDVKAGNILVDSNGTVKLADFGVSACMFDTGDRQRARNTFCGTPCWMAPEVMQQLHGYDFKADIWSFGITALELAHGHAPFSKYPPMKVLLMTLQNAPPGLDYERDKRFSKSFKEIVAACLVKDPKKRPTSKKLLKHPFFKHARSCDFLSRTILDGLSPLGDRFRILKEKDVNLLLQNQAMHPDKEQLSQQEYMRGISAWNFNLDDLKKEAALIHDDDDDGISVEDSSLKQKDQCDKLGFNEEGISIEKISNHVSSPTREDALQNVGLLASSPSDPHEIPAECGNICEDGSSACSLAPHHSTQIVVGNSKSSPGVKDKELGNALGGPGFQHKGRFKVTVADSEPKESLNGFRSPLVSEIIGSTTAAKSGVLPSLQCALPQNMKEEQLAELVGYSEPNCGHHTEHADATSTNEELQLSGATTGRERYLESAIIHFQESIETFVEELQRRKRENAPV